MLQVGSSNDPNITSDFDVMARDLRALAAEGAAQNPPIRMWVMSVVSAIINLG